MSIETRADAGLQSSVSYVVGIKQRLNDIAHLRAMRSHSGCFFILPGLIWART